MAKVSVLIDTDIFIDYFNTGRFSSLFDTERFIVYYSIITKKELLMKRGLRDAERDAVLKELRPCRLINLSRVIATRYSDLRQRYPKLEKNDAPRQTPPSRHPQPSTLPCCRGPHSLWRIVSARTLKLPAIAGPARNPIERVTSVMSYAAICLADISRDLRRLAS